MNSSSPVYPFERTPALLVDLSFFRRADRKERRSVLGGRQLLARKEFRLNAIFCQEYFSVFLRKTPEILRVSALFSPVLTSGCHPFLPLLVAFPLHHNYILCFCCFRSPIHVSAHLSQPRTLCSLLCSLHPCTGRFTLPLVRTAAGRPSLQTPDYRPQTHPLLLHSCFS